MIAVKVLKLDPYHPVLGLLVPQVAQRLIEHVKQLGDSSDTVLNVLSRLWAGDPTVLMLAALDAKGLIKGHAVASIEGNDVFLLQPKVDEDTGKDTIGEFIALVEQWIKQYNVTLAKLGHPGIKDISLVARRADPKWAKKYDFETVKYVMKKKIGE